MAGGAARAAGTAGRGVLARGRRWLDRGAATREERYARRLTYIDSILQSELCTPEFLGAAGDAAPERLLVDVLAARREGDAVEQLMAADIGMYLPDCLLVKVDIASMAHALEARSPLLDHVLMEFVAALPADYKLRNGGGKHLLRKVAASLLPPEILTRRKMGFGVPLDHWFRGALRELTRDVLLGSTADRGLFRRDVVARWIDEHERGLRNWHDHLWTLLMLELWYRTFIDRRVAPRAGVSGGAVQGAASVAPSTLASHGG